MSSSADRIWAGLGAASGIVAVVLDQVGFGLTITGSRLEPGASKDEIAQAFAAPASQRVLLGLYLLAFVSLFFLVFAARTWATLRGAEGDPGWLSATAFGAALLFVATHAAALAARSATFARAGQGFDATAGTALVDLNNALFAVSLAFGALFLAAAGVVSLRMNALPQWLGWSAVVIAVALMAAVAVPTAGIAFLPFLLFELWIVVTAVVFIVRPEATGVPERVPVRAKI